MVRTRISNRAVTHEYELKDQKGRLRISMYPGVGSMKYNFAASYYNDNRDELASVSFGCDGIEKMQIYNIQKSNSIFVNDFKHLGTELLSDAIIDTIYRREVPVKEIYGTMSKADRDNGNWRKSVPFYINFPKYFKAFNLEFYLYDDHGNEVDLERDIDQIVNEMYESDKEYKFVYKIK